MNIKLLLICAKKTWKIFHAFLHGDELVETLRSFGFRLTEKKKNHFFHSKDILRFLIQTDKMTDAKIRCLSLFEMDDDLPFIGM